MPRYNPKSYNSKAYKPGHYSAYPRERRPTPRRIWRYTAAAGLLLLILLSLTSSPHPDPRDAVQPIDPFGRDPVKHNGTHTPRWQEHEEWHVPFSDIITNDRSVTLIPPSRERPLIYTYYHAQHDNYEQIKAAERKLLLVWKRAWWAKGFEPVILGEAETVKNPLYEKFKSLKNVHASTWNDIRRWLAWEQMGGGVLANWLVVPMDSGEDDVLAFLRGGEFTKITVYEGLGSGLLTGNKTSIRNALETALDSPNLSDLTFLLDLLPSETISTKPQPDSLAYYSSSTLESQYPHVFTAVTYTPPAGLTSLAELITSHLRQTFLNTFTSGIEILAPHNSSTLILAYPALTFANALTTCPSSPLPKSCPPNNPSCTPCSPHNPHPIKLAESYTNSSTLFTITAVPHPYTLSSLLLQPPSTLSVSHIRRTAARDPYLRSTTLKPLGPALSGLYRILDFKRSVASESEGQRNLWLAAEDEAAWAKEEIEWRLGFEIPAYTPASFGGAKDMLAVLGTASAREDDVKVGEIREQRDIFLRSQSVLGLSVAGNERKKASQKSNGPGAKERERDVVNAAGAWHLSDMEAWSFVWASGARTREERREFWEPVKRRGKE
ncbi:MAG: hypothetical protein Q9218_004716 [Villophora microphyllina]